MGGPGAGRVSRHELNAVPKSDVGHGDRTLVIGEPTAPAPACRCHPPTSITTSTSNSTTSGHHLVPAQLPPSPPPLTSLHLAVDNNCIGNNSNTTTAKPDAISNGTKAAATMSSPPKHRRGFDPNDVNATDYRRYRRVKTTRR
ncbi:hypothetical protein K0M31_014959 [Melipona bicolor]|uniref:Uncharacterized protein n=1 Tax=Melipona bicolor TaxID=60889 RepID=A0AA40FGM8_9HYME|nr:hypothetical protein K0M31_014959 [Melipona bicolor]